MRYLILWILVLAVGGCNVDEQALKALNAPEKNNTKSGAHTSMSPAAATKEEPKAAKAPPATKTPRKEEIERRFAADKAALEHDLALKKMELDAKLRTLQAQNEKLQALKSLDLQQQAQRAQIEEERRKYALEEAKLREETRRKIAELKVQKELELARVQADQRLKKERLDHTLAQQKLQHGLKMEQLKERKAQEDRKITLLLIAVVAGLVLLGLLILYLLVRRHQQIKLKMHEERLKKEQQMQLVQLQHERINKMLEIVGSEKELPEKVEKELLFTIKEASGVRFVIDEDPKRKKGLIFRSGRD